jgi:TolB-like protein/tRNA A-37 threonylcarbamoyl transferase component Bud32/Tfp pilus assembly protein PilF
MDLRDQLQQSLGAAYTIERELGGGGMSRVFVAEETALGRKVVVKVLSPELAAEVSVDRFTREIRFAASLQQANIVPVLATGAAGGLPYFTMPFVQGLSLRQRLEKGPLSISETTGILRDVARALVYAHEHGIVHRDIKPENVLLSGDAAVVTDFGIAKAISAARTEPGVATLTQAGMTLGTPEYMAPEQATGDPNIDHRADLYSFGCMAYELLTGASPFHGRPVAALIAAHLTEVPAAVATRRPDCPPAIEQMVMGCLEKDPERRPQSARDVLRALDAVTTPVLLGTPRSSRRRIAGVAGAAVVLAAVVAIIVILGRQRAAGSDAGTKSLAVLPFANIGGDSAQEYLADGMSDELTTAFGKVQGVQVAARTLANRYRGRRDVDAREAGRTLGVAYILQGSVRSAGKTLRVSAQLASVRDGRELWADTYDRTNEDVFAVQDEITRRIMAALQQRLTGPASKAVAQAAQGTANAAAYDLYLRGRFLLERRGAGVEQSIGLFQRAIDMDSTFGRAYAGLSEALEFTPYFGSTPAPALRERVTRVAGHALALDSSLAEAHVALGLAHMHAWEWNQARDEFRHATASDPNDASAHTQYARLLVYTSKWDEARTELERAKGLDPNSAVVSAWLAETFWLSGRREEAMAEFKRALEIDSTIGPALDLAAHAYAAAGDKAEARRIAYRMRGGPPVFVASLAYLAGVTGDKAYALRVAHEMEAKHPRPWFGEWTIADAYLGVGDTAKALDALERSTAAGEIWPSFDVVSGEKFDPLRASPRFAALLRRVGLDERLLTQPHGGRLGG